MWRHKNCAITPPPGENLCSQKVLRSGTIANLPLTTCHPSSFSFLNLRASLSNVSSQRMMLQCSNGWKYCKSDFVLLSLFSIKSCIIKDLVPNRVKMLCASDKVKEGQWKTRTRIVWKLVRFPNCIVYSWVYNTQKTVKFDFDCFHSLH